LQHFRRQGNDLHVVLGAKLARNRSEDTGADWFFLVVDKNGSVRIEADDTTVRTTDVLGGADDNRLHYVTLLYAAARNSFLDGDDDDVSDRSILPLRAAKHFDAHDTTGAGIVRHVEVCLHLNHDGRLLIIMAESSRNGLLSFNLTPIRPALVSEPESGSRSQPSTCPWKSDAIPGSR